MPKSVTTFLMFQGAGEEALNFYARGIGGLTVGDIQRYGPGEAGEEGAFKSASFSLKGQEFMCFDSPPVHEFTFTPSMSLFLECEDTAEIDRLYATLSDGGAVMMPLGSYGFSEKYAWVADRFGVSWQLNLA